MFSPEDYFTVQTVYLHFIYLLNYAVVLTGFPEVWPLWSSQGFRFLSEILVRVGFN